MKSRGDRVSTCGRFVKKGKGSYRDKKPVLAAQICQYLTKDNISGVLDLKERLDEICAIEVHINNYTALSVELLDDVRKKYALLEVLLLALCT